MTTKHTGQGNERRPSGTDLPAPNSPPPTNRTPQTAMEWKNLYRGAIMGAVDVIPGVSGGTMALLLGIYERLIGAINGFFSTNWRRQLGFLIPLGIGILASIFALSRVIEWLYDHHQVPTRYFFMGLILGVLPFLLNKSDAKHTYKAKHYLVMAIGFAVVAVMGILNVTDGSVITEFSTSTYVLLFVSGAIASAALILPGISGAFMLLVLGVYPTVIGAVSNFILPVLVVTATGVLLGFVVMSKVINYFLQNHFTLTFAATSGLVLGSMVVVFPGLPAGVLGYVISICTFFVGLAVAYFMGRFEYK